MKKQNVIEVRNQGVIEWTDMGIDLKDRANESFMNKLTNELARLFIINGEQVDPDEAYLFTHAYIVEPKNRKDVLEIRPQYSLTIESGKLARQILEQSFIALPTTLNKLKFHNSELTINSEEPVLHMISRSRNSSLKTQVISAVGIACSISLTP